MSESNGPIEPEIVTDIEVTKRPTVIREEAEQAPLNIGDWYWVTTANYKNEQSRWLGCITHVGTNFAEFSSVPDQDGSRWVNRVHFDEFDKCCVPEPNAQQIIESQIARFQLEVQELLEEVKQITSGLAITPRGSLTSGSETQALALRGNSQPVGEYKAALISAKNDLLLTIFKRIEKASEHMANWMKAPLIPLKAEAGEMKGVIKVIEGRIFNVELYAGLVEDVVQIKEGEPASIEEPVRIFQRRAYMDEECLANYQAGGMDFQNIEAFDKWLVRADNLSRILPFQRCVIAFQVRRYDKEREASTLGQYIKMWNMEKADKWTFLYIRNGEQVFRLSTGIEFGKQLFPDTEHNLLMKGQKIYAKKSASSISDMISEAEYQGLKDEYAKRRKKQADAIRDLRRRKVPRKEWFGEANYEYFGIRDGSSEFFLWSPDSVYYDDVAEAIQDQMDAHNRLVLVLQGLFDRSPVFHPHPPYQLWSADGFSNALQLIYDDSRALTSGDAIDFEEYRAQLNSSLKAGCITVGQEQAWLEREAEKENNRRASDWRLRGEYYELKTFQPYGNPGPGRVAKVVHSSSKGATFKWERERQVERWRHDSKYLPASVTLPTSRLLNISAYTPGDYSLFFADPRTRANYLQWAPLLLTAEEYCAGNLQVGNIGEDS